MLMRELRRISYNEKIKITNLFIPFYISYSYYSAVNLRGILNFYFLLIEESMIGKRFYFRLRQMRIRILCEHKLHYAKIYY